MIAFPDAQREVVDACAALAAQNVGLEEAVGRVAALSVRAIEDLIPFARSAMDGFAIAVDDLTSLPQTLPVAGAVFAARTTLEHIHARGTATAIATGAALPVGADAVVPIEDVELIADSIRITQRVEPGEAIFPPGEDARAGDVLLERGTVITPGMLGILAAAGHGRVSVHRKPVVSILCGGDELVSIGERPGHGQIRNSNAPVIAATLIAFGAVVRCTVALPDDRESIRVALGEALRASDLVITTGGASVGERDFIKGLCIELGVHFAFDTVALRPAKPTAFGRHETAAIAVLPGNPAAAFVALHEFVRPAVRALSGDRDLFAPRVFATLDGTINAKPQRHFAAFAALAATSAGLVARPLENQCSSLTRTIAESCGFILVPPGSHTYRAGDSVPFDVVDWSKLERR